jgi:uncharacterized protein YbjQ (UPF0145 family)
MEYDQTEYIISERDFQLKRLEEIRTALDEARQTGNWSKVPVDIYREYLAKVVLSASSTITERPVLRQIDFISAETVFITKMSDFNQNVQFEKHSEQEFQHAKRRVMQLLRAQALCCNADAVTDVKLQHSLIDAEGSQKRFLIVATGTAVQLQA